MELTDVWISTRGVDFYNTIDYNYLAEGAIMIGSKYPLVIKLPSASSRSRWRAGVCFLGDYMARKSTGKRKRFEIFKRDSFTCQYCGAQPPDVVLVIDHVVPVAGDGSNDDTNLITSCETCNQGKSDIPLSKIAPRPDADLEWLYMQQELVELRRYRLAKAERDAILVDIADDLANDFIYNSGYHYLKPDRIAPTIDKMLRKYAPDIVEEALLVSSQRISAGKVSISDWQPYTYGVLKNMEKENSEREAPIH